MKKIIPVIVGPTASGKSAFAIEIAKKINAEIINADSLQVYSDLHILSARPTKAEQQNIPHHLYGYIDAYSTCSVASWLNDVKNKLETVENPLFVGGTGLYISALTQGISPMPAVDENIREDVRKMDIADVQKRLIDCKAIDPQRQRRALEIQLSTGKPLSFFQNQPKIKIIDKDFQIFFLNPPRDILYQRCNSRFIKMLDCGAINEVIRLNNIKATGGVLKAIGVSQIKKYLDNEITKEQMIDLATKETRHYAKRQITWFKNQFPKAITLTNETQLEILETYFNKNNLF